MKNKWSLLGVIVVFYVLGMVGIGWSTYDKTNPDVANKIIETVKIVFIMLGGLGVILPSYLNIWQSLENSLLVQDDLKRKTIENSFQLLSKWDDKSLIDARNLTSDLKKEEQNISANELVIRINQSQELRMSVILLLNYFDLVRTSIKYKRVDKEIIKESLGKTITSICKRLEPFISTLPPTTHFNELTDYLKD
jgi:hypothetical protein